MGKLKKRILTAAIFSVFFLISSPVQAADFTDNQTVDSCKAWTVSFNSEVSFDDLTKQGIKVTDSAGTKANVGLQLGQDGKTIKIKSGSLSTDYDIEQALSDIDKFQLNTLNIPVKIDIENLSSSDAVVDKSSEEKAINLIKKLTGKNINVILEPYPWIAGGEKSETNWKPKNIDAFFVNWKTKVLKKLIDDIAVQYNLYALNIGSNLVNIEPEEKNWCDIIDYVRANYKGLVTYRTNFWVTASFDPESVAAYENKLNNKLFSKLDFISIAAYFELTNNPTNTVENLMSAIESSQIVVNGQVRNQNIKQEIENFYHKWNKPIFFGELGFPKIDGASIYPWNPYENSTVNNVEQANCFEAYKREFEKEPWFLGFSIFAIGKQGEDKYYYPSEESTSVIRTWYSGEQ